MHCALLVATCLALPGPALQLVDCSTACARCRGRDADYPGVLEVYCAMCRECRRPRRRDDDQVIHEVPNHSEECPTPPPCESDEEESPVPDPVKKLLKKSTTPSVTTTTRTPCPVITGCKKKSKPPPRCYIPCMPACPCPPFPPHPLVDEATVTKEPSSTHKSTAYLYVYVGIPKQITDNTNQ